MNYCPVFFILAPPNTNNMTRTLLNAFSVIVSVLLSQGLFGQACLPTYSVACTSADFINNFSTTGGTTNASNLNTGCNGPSPNNYTDFSATQVLTISPGNTFNFTVQAGTSWGQGFRILLDYNADGDFLDVGEDAWNSGFSSTSAFTGSITVPLTAAGVSKMRVICQYAGVPSGPCITASFGECEDYGAVFCLLPPTPSAVSPVAACVNNTATLTATSSSGTLAWFANPTGGTPLGTGGSYTTPPFTSAGSFTYYVETQNGGCSSSRVPVTVNVSAAAVVNLGLDTTLCGTSFTLNAGNPGSSYLWSTGAGTQSININSSGTYSVVVQTPLGCIGTDNITVTLNAPPAYDLGNDTVFCGTVITLDAGPGFTSYLWSTGSTSQTTTVNSTSMVYVTLQDAGGCTLEDSVLVTLSAAPSVALGADTTRCGGTVTLDAGNPGSIYFWSNNTTGQTSTVNSSGTYYVDVITPAGCLGSDTIVVTINNQPNANLGPDTSICQGSITLDAGNPGSTYAWSNSASTQTITVGTGTYFVTVTDPSGCFDQDTVLVQANVPPTITVSSDTAICSGGQATLTATGGIGYLWSNGAPTQTITVSPTTNTAYYVTVVDANGCTASDFVIVNTLPTQTAQFTHTVSGSTAVFSNQSSSAYTYSWSFGDNTTSNAVNPSHTYTQNGTYTVTLTVTGPCGTSTFTQVVTITQVGLDEHQTLNNVSLYPNPNDGAFTISFEMTQETDVQIQVLDVAGRIVWSDQPGALMVYNKQVALNTEASGMYVVRIITPSHVNHLKVNVVK